MIDLAGPQIRDRLFTEFVGQSRASDQFKWVKELIATFIPEVCSLHSAYQCEECGIALKDDLPQGEPHFTPEMKKKEKLCPSCLNPVEGRAHHKGCMVAGKPVKRTLEGATYYLGLGEDKKIVAAAKYGDGKQAMGEYDDVPHWQKLFDETIRPDLDEKHKAEVSEQE